MNLYHFAPKPLKTVIPQLPQHNYTPGYNFKISYWYTVPRNLERHPLSGIYKHHAVVSLNTIYDSKKNPLGLGFSHNNEVGASLNFLKKSGYHGALFHMGGYSMVVMFYPVPVRFCPNYKQKPFRPYK